VIGAGGTAQGKHTEALDLFRSSLRSSPNWCPLGYCATPFGNGAKHICHGNDSEAEHLWHDSCASMETHGMITTMEAIVGVASMQAKRGILIML